MSVQVEVMIATVMREQPVQILLVHICVHAETVMKEMERLAVFPTQVNRAETCRIKGVLSRYLLTF